MTVLVALLLSTLTTPPPAARADAAHGSLAVRTDRGWVRGAAHRDGGRVFQGIPFAAPPTGRLRWRPPRPAERWSGVRDATEPADPCAQLPLTLLPDGGPVLPGESNRTGSTTEDCLYLNVWTPARTGGRPLPVLVWLHGGGNAYGAGSDYDGSALAARGAVVVTVNYRLGALGFLAHPALSSESGDHASGDYGLMDQQAALRWVRHNIGAFGGDRDRVTLAGQSAGSVDTCAHIASPTAKGLFQRAIQQSGSCASDGGLTPLTLAAAEQKGRDFAASVGCTDPTTAATCLRALPTTELLRGTGTGPTASLWGPNTGPRLLPRPPHQAWAEGRVNAVPTLTGTTHDEYRYFTALYVDLLGDGPLTPASYAALIALQHGGRAAAVLATYPASAYPSPNLAYSAVNTDQRFACPARADSGLYDTRAPVYAYEFHDPQAPPFIPAPHTPQGAFHASELAYLFPMDSLRLTPAQRRLSATMTAYWTRFAATGDPNAPGAPAWPRYTAERDRVQVLAPDRVAPTTGFATDHHCAFWLPSPPLPGEPRHDTGPPATVISPS